MSARLDDTGRDALRDAAADIIADFRGPYNRKLSSRKEMRWGTFGSFSLVISGPKQGLWHDHESNRGGDIIEFIKTELHCSFREALDYASHYVGELRDRPAPRATPRPTVDDDDDEARIANAVAIWCQARTIRGTMVEMYLRGRGITELPAAALDILRFHPRCPWGNDTTRPAMVALVRDILTNEPLGIHRTALTSDGRKLERPKMLGPTGGGAIKLSGDVVSDEITIGEGIETALSAPLLGLGWSVWSALDAGGIARFPVLPDVKRLTIAVDHDPKGVGQKKAATCKARWILAGRDVRTIMSKTKGEDLNDILQRVRGCCHG
jgi:putative DNA primase/helicase